MGIQQGGSVYFQLDSCCSLVVWVLKGQDLDLDFRCSDTLQANQFNVGHNSTKLST
jgi:hypothetical protein